MSAQSCAKMSTVFPAALKVACVATFDGTAWGTRINHTESGLMCENRDFLSSRGQFLTRDDFHTMSKPKHAPLKSSAWSLRFGELTRVVVWNCLCFC